VIEAWVRQRDPEAIISTRKHVPVIRGRCRKDIYTLLENPTERPPYIERIGPYDPNIRFEPLEFIETVEAAPI
jgi:hypothetical protein